MTLDPKINAIIKRLEHLIPLFQEHIPEGWIDFRDSELSKEWRGGTYWREGVAPDWLEVKSVFGSRAMANLAASQFYAATGHRALCIPGLRSDGSVTGDENLSQVIISMPLSGVNW